MLKVYIHGRPQGQDIWSVAPVGDDKFYLNPFLDSKIGDGMDAALLIDVWQGNAYYSYIHRKNVSEKGNRPNAYFAITICFEKHLCTEVSMLYDLLDSVYKQLCLNNIIEKAGEQERFLISQFKEKENVLNQVNTVIVQNVNKLMVHNLISLETNIDTTKKQVKTYANVDVDSPQFFSDCKSYRTLVAPIITSKDKLPIELNQRISVLESEKNKLAEDRNNWQSKAERTYSENQQLLENKKDLQNQVVSLNDSIKTIKQEVESEYKNQIQKLQKELEEQKNLVKELDKGIKQKDVQLQQLDSDLKKLQKAHKSPASEPANPKDKKSKDISDKKEQQVELPVDTENLSEVFNFIKYTLRRMAGRFPVAEKYITIGSTLFNSILLIVIFIFLYLGTKKDDNAIDVDYVSARIDIPELNGGNLKVDSMYTLQLKNVSTEENYRWKVEGCSTELEGNTFVVKDTGEITIKCINSSNIEVKQRKVKAEK